MERNKQGQPDGDGDPGESVEVRKWKRQEINMGKTCFCVISQSQVDKTHFLYFVFSPLSILDNVMLKIVLLLPRRDFPEAFWGCQKISKKREKNYFYSFFHHRTLVSQRHSQKKQKYENRFRVDSYS